MSAGHLRKAIDLHFAGSISPGQEAELRTHLPGCAACRGYYERHLLLAKLDPAALKPEDRMARGLGIRASSPGLAWGWARPLTVAAVGAFCAVLAVQVIPGLRAQPDLRSDFVARGRPDNDAFPPKLQIYEVRKSGPSLPVGEAIGRREELAFAYENPLVRDVPWLMIFGVDEEKRVVWYYPEWTDSKLNPTSISSATGPGVHELPDAIRQTLTGRTLTVCALFSQKPWTVREAESWIAKTPGPRFNFAVQGATEDCHQLTVEDRP